jgi:PhoPQ-activated pathogenicity-related protein
MTKAAVKAMDTITDFAQKKGVANIEKYMVAGASKVKQDGFLFISFRIIIIFVFELSADGPLGLL